MNLAAATIRRWRESAETFFREALGFVPDAWQSDALAAYDRRERSAMQACVGPGKSAVLAGIGWQFMFCHADRGKHPNGIALSITGDNLKSGLWKELAVWYQRSPILQAAFEMTAERIFARDHPKTWWLEARSYAKTATTEAQGMALSGLHSPYVLYLLDETGEMHPTLLRRAEQGMSNVEYGRIVIAGNPTSIQGALYEAAVNQAKHWDVTIVTGDPDDPKRSPRINAEWARRQIDQHGRDNPWVMSSILGKFPPGGLNSLLTPDEVRAAMARNPTPDAYSWAQRRLGIDVARFGDDRTVIIPRQGVAAYPPIVMRHGRDTPVAVDIGNRVLARKMEWGSEVELFDDTVGWAHGAIDYCRVNGGTPIPVNFGDVNTIDPRYANRRSEMWMAMAERIRADLALPNIPELLTELCAPTYGFKGGKWMLEDKDAIKERLGYSPDIADALALTFAIPDQPSATSHIGVGMLRQRHSVAADYHPHARLSRR